MKLEKEFVSIEPRDNEKGEPGYVAVCKDGYAVWYPKSSFEMTNRKVDSNGN